MTSQMYALTPAFSIDLSTIRSVDTSTNTAHVQLDSGVIHITQWPSKSCLHMVTDIDAVSYTLDTDVTRAFLRAALLRSALREQTFVPVLNPEDELPSEIADEDEPVFDRCHSPCPPLCPADESQAYETVQGLGRARAEEWAAIKKNTRSVQHIYDDGDSSSDYNPDEEARRYRNAARFLEIRHNEKVSRSLFGENVLRVSVALTIRDENIDAIPAHTTIDFSNVEEFKWSTAFPTAYDVVFSNGACMFAAPSYFEFYPDGYGPDTGSIGGMWGSPTDHARIAWELQIRLVKDGDTWVKSGGP